MSYLDDHVQNTLGVPIGAEVTIRFKVAGIVDFGREVQLQTSDGLLTYLPTETVVKVLGNE